MWRALPITLALFALLFVIELARYAPPPPLPRGASEDRFSGERARDVQARLVGDGSTRYVGTPGNPRGRGVVMSELERLGFIVETQSATSCTYHGFCAPITNVVARLPG